MCDFLFIECAMQHLKGREGLELIVKGFSALESSELVLEIDYRGLWQASLHIQGFSFILRSTFTWIWNFKHIRRLKK